MARSSTSETGFSLIEVLVVVAVLGVLAAIVIPSYGALRERGWRAAVESDLRNGALGMYTFFATEERFPTADELTLPTSDGVTLTIALPGPADDGREFCIEAHHASLGPGVAATYDSRISGFGDAC